MTLVPLAIRRLLTCHYVIDVGDGKAVPVNAPLPGILEPLNTMRSENQVQVERTVPKSNEILVPLEFLATVCQ
jgi:hypothetical protein